ncbi:MAG: hypothetical protein M1816_001193 [Peltula sp. TS41687]|nr:MAG: hypothetical protein M1816_001193 [Peltula sp. TS41687]
MSEIIKDDQCNGNIDSSVLPQEVGLIKGGGPPGPGGMALPAEVKKPVETDRIENGKRSETSQKNKDELKTSGRPNLGQRSSTSQHKQQQQQQQSSVSKNTASSSSASPKQSTSSSPSNTKTNNKPSERTVLHIDPPTSSSSLRQQKQKQKQTQVQGQEQTTTAPHHEADAHEQHHHQHPYDPPLFDTYTIVQDLESKGFSQAQSVTMMKTIRALLLTNLEHANEELVSKSDVENRTYLFQAATSELRTEISTKRNSEAERLRTERMQLQHEVDILSQKLNQDLLTLKDTLKGMFDDRKMAVRMEQRNMETSIQELNYKITVSLNSDVKSEVEGLRWVLTRRAAMAVAGMAFLILSSLRYNSWRLHREEELAKQKQQQSTNSKEGGEGDDGHQLQQRPIDELVSPSALGGAAAVSVGVEALANNAAISGGGGGAKEGDGGGYVSLG